NKRGAERAWNEKVLPLAWPGEELALVREAVLGNRDAQLACNTFLEAKIALEQEVFAAVLPDFLHPENPVRFFQLRPAELESFNLHYKLAWNPRLLRLNPHATRRRDF